LTHLLVTNDYPPKLGGIQTYLRELWRRLPAESFVVLTAARVGSREFDRREPYAIERVRARTLLPTPRLVHRVRRLAERTGAGLVVLDPAFPLGLIGPRLGVPYGVVLHGAEVTVPGRLPGSRRLLRDVLAGASLAVAAGPYPETEARRIAAGSMPPTVNVPPGVDTYRFRPRSPTERLAARRRFGLGEAGPLVVSVSRLVPRKGMDVLIEAAARLATTRQTLTVAIAGSGRDEERLRRLARRRAAPVRFLGAVPDGELPALCGAADVAAMLCRDRWIGLEREGFGIVFVEAAACGVPQVAGDSGGAGDAVIEGTTGLVVRRPADPRAAASAIAVLLDDEALRRRLGAAARARAVADLDLDVLAGRLEAALWEAGG
jgi:phosphatidylinositol alpha-1,6-mannosyltransferase